MNPNRTAKKAALILADGTVYEGLSVGARGTAVGETLFTTLMVGAQETLTNPSYCGKLVVFCFPLIGNPGVNEEDVLSENATVGGVILREICEEPSNFRGQGTLEDYLERRGIIGLYDLDTRALTRHLREHGVQRGMITTEYAPEKKEELVQQLRAHREEELLSKVSVPKGSSYEAENRKGTVAVLDLGLRKSLREALLSLGYSLQVFPQNTKAKELLAQDPDGILVAGGPGDPREQEELQVTVKALMESGRPLLGVGLGHQLMALVAGAQVEKMVHGHHGGNQPVKNLKTGRIMATTQHHGYVVVPKGLSQGTVTYQNVNDLSCEGIAYTGTSMSVQFAPEAHSEILPLFAAWMEEEK